MKKKSTNTLDKFMATRLNIKNTKSKKVTLPAGDVVEVPRLSYKHFVKVKDMDAPDKILEFIVDGIKPRELTRAETEFLLIHIFYHNSAKDKSALDTIGVNLDEMTITEPQYDYTFDNIRLVFNPATITNIDIISLIKKAYVDDQEVELTDDKRIDLINSLYRYEIDQIELGVLQEVYVMHEGDRITGFNIIGD